MIHDLLTEDFLCYFIRENAQVIIFKWLYPKPSL